MYEPVTIGIGGHLPALAKYSKISIAVMYAFVQKIELKLVINYVLSKCRVLYVSEYINVYSENWTKCDVLQTWARKGWGGYSPPGI
jgi:hypothetical protein